MGALPEAVAFPRIDYQLGGDAALQQGAVEFLSLAERRAAIEVAMDDEGRRGRPVEPEQRRAVDGDRAELLILERPTHDELAEIVIAGIVAAPLVGDAGDHD